MTEVAVVIVNFNGADLVVDSARRAVAAAQGDAWQVIVVDNASTDGSVEAVARLPGIELVRNAQNLGFGVACNAGAARSRAPWVLFLNPDCALAADVVPTLIREASLDPSCVALGPRIVDPDGATQGSARGDPSMLAGVLGRTGVLTRLLPGLQRVARQVVWPETLPVGATSVTVDWLSGACLLVRREAFEAVGGFDPGFFLYWEDADLCRRLRIRGGSVRYVPGVSVRHVVGQSSRHAREASLRAFHASAYRYYARWNAPSTWDPRRPITRLVLAARLRAQLAGARRNRR